MRLTQLAVASLRSRRLSAALTVLIITLSACLLIGVERIRTQAREGFASTVSGTDLIVGARSGPVNLLLYSIFHIGDATNNVSWQSYRELSTLPEVEWAVPLSLGDSYRGYRVVGTTGAYFEHYRYGAGHGLAFAEGAPFADVYDAVVGAEVVRQLRTGINDHIVLSHGTGKITLAQHADKPFKVVGVLARTGTPVDSSVLVSLDGIEAVHVDWQSGVHLPGRGISADQARHMDLTPTGITAFMLGLRSRIAVFSVQRTINEYPDEALLAIMPGVALQQLWRSMAVAEGALRVISMLVILLGLVSMIATLVASLDARRREMAVLRAIGARPWEIALLLVFEATGLALVGCVLSVIALSVSTVLARGWVLDEFGLVLTQAGPNLGELCWLAAVVVAGFLSGLIPALLVYRNTLADGLNPRT